MRRDSLRRTAVGSMVVLASICASLAIVPAANATITNVFSGTAAPIPCAVQGSGVRLCDQTIAGNPVAPRAAPSQTFDGVPIDVRVAFPPEPVCGPGRPVSADHAVPRLRGVEAVAREHDAVPERGLRDHEHHHARLRPVLRHRRLAHAELGAICNNGYVRLMDTRYEVRDAQELSGMLADEGRTSFTQIGAIGGSYGGGMSMALASLQDRKMLPDGSLVPWTSPLGTPMAIAAATPEIPWTDLAYSLLPNGKTLDYVADAPYQGRTGVLKSSWENALYGSGLVASTTRRPARTQTPTCATGTRCSTPASPTTTRAATRWRPRRHPRRAHHAPLVLLHRSLSAAGADADLERLHR